MNVGMMASYDQVKETITAMNGPGLSTNLASSAAAGFFCAFASLPFDMMKTRLQNMKALPNGEMPYNGLADCAVKIFKHEGFSIFEAGAFIVDVACHDHISVEGTVTNVQQTFGKEV